MYIYIYIHIYIYIYIYIYVCMCVCVSLYLFTRLTSLYVNAGVMSFQGFAIGNITVPWPLGVGAYHDHFTFVHMQR